MKLHYKRTMTPGSLLPEDANSQFDAYLIEMEEESSAKNWELIDSR